MNIKRPTILRASVLLFAPVFACLLFSLPSFATYAGQNGKLLYRTADNVVRMGDPDGSNATTITDMGLSPFFAPNGTNIVSAPDYSNALTFTNLATSSSRTFTLSGPSIRLADNGIKVSYVKGNYSYAANLDGSQERVTSYLNHLKPSPDGKKGASITSIYQYPSIYIYTNADQAVGSPDKGGYSAYYEDSDAQTIGCSSWSPNSDKIAFTYIYGYGTSWRNEVLKVVDINTKAVQTYDVNAPFLGCPVWSPDQTKIIYSANHGDYYVPQTEDFKLDMIDLTTGIESTLQDAHVIPLDWQSINSEIPVYRFWSNTKNHHFYTSNYDETLAVLQAYDDNTWAHEASAFKVHPLSSGSCQGDKSPIYRFWSDKYQGHFYTISLEEKDLIVSKWPTIWNYEGAVFCANTSPSGSFNNPVYRFWSDKYQGHFYTTSAAERDSIIQTWPAHIWKYEGVAYYVAN